MSSCRWTGEVRRPSTWCDCEQFFIIQIQLRHFSGPGWHNVRESCQIICETVGKRELRTIYSGDSHLWREESLRNRVNIRYTRTWSIPTESGVVRLEEVAVVVTEGDDSSTRVALGFVRVFSS